MSIFCTASSLDANTEANSRGSCSESGDELPSESLLADSHSCWRRCTHTAASVPAGLVVYCSRRALQKHVRVFFTSLGPLNFDLAVWMRSLDRSNGRGSFRSTKLYVSHEKKRLWGGGWVGEVAHWREVEALSNAGAPAAGKGGRTKEILLAFVRSGLRHPSDGVLPGRASLLLAAAALAGPPAPIASLRPAPGRTGRPST